jgi:hypothetical protein
MRDCSEKVPHPSLALNFELFWSDLCAAACKGQVMREVSVLRLQGGRDLPVSHCVQYVAQRAGEGREGNDLRHKGTMSQELDFSGVRPVKNGNDYITQRQLIQFF